MNRRKFLAGSAVAAGASLLAKAQMHNQKATRICISTWSFHNLFTPTHDKDAAPISGTPMDARDFPDMIADRYHVHEMEIVAPHISPQPSHIRDLKARLDRAHSHLVNIPVDIEELWSA